MRNTKHRVGVVEQAILSALSRLRPDVVLTGAELAKWIYGNVPTDAQKASIRRAVLRLRDKGMVVKAGIGWSLTQSHRRYQGKERSRQRERQKAEEAARELAFGDDDFETKPRTQAVKTRLAHLLGMLGSDHDGEVISAARQIEKERRRLGKTWHELRDVTSA